MNKNIEALNVYDTLKLALEALDHNSLFTSLMSGYDGRIIEKAYKAINKSLAEQPAPVAEVREQQSAERVEPVEVKQIAEALRQVGLTLVRTNGGFRVMDLGHIEAQTTSPPANANAGKPWVGLTDEQIAEIAATPCAVAGSYVHTFARAIEAKLRERNEHREKNA